MDRIIEFNQKAAAPSQWAAYRARSDNYAFYTSYLIGAPDSALNLYEMALRNAIRDHWSKYPSDVIISDDLNARSYYFRYVAFTSGPSSPPTRLELSDYPSNYVTYRGLDANKIEDQAAQMWLWDWRELFVDDASNFFGLRGPGAEAQYNYFFQYSPAWSGGGTNQPVLPYRKADAQTPSWLIAFAAMHFHGDVDIARKFLADPKYKDHFPAWLDSLFEGLIAGLTFSAFAAGAATIVGDVAGTAGTATGTATTAGETAAETATETAASSSSAAAAGVTGVASGSEGVLGTVGGFLSDPLAAAGAAATAALPNVIQDLGDLISPTSGAPAPALPAKPAHGAPVPSAPASQLSPLLLAGLAVLFL